MNIDDLIAQVARRFESAEPSNAEVNTRLAEFTNGVLEAEAGDAIPTPATTWVRLGFLVQKYLAKEAAKDPGLKVIGKLGPVREQE